MHCALQADFIHLSRWKEVAAETVVSSHDVQALAVHRYQALFVTVAISYCADYVPAIELALGTANDPGSIPLHHVTLAELDMIYEMLLSPGSSTELRNVLIRTKDSLHIP